MKIAILIANDLYTRSFLRTSAFSYLKNKKIYFLISDEVEHRNRVEKCEQAEEIIVDSSQRRESLYALFRTITMVHLRKKSATFRIKTSQIEYRQRVLYIFLGLPFIFQCIEKIFFRKLGFNHNLRRTLKQIQPDIVVAPTAGTDALVLDLVREAKNLNIPSLLLVNGWDNLSSKATFSVEPDYFGVWGKHSLEDLSSIHNFNTKKARVLGVPTFDHYFNVQRKEKRPSLIDGPYVLFAGSALAFDEISALKSLDAYLAVHHRDLKIIYRPHPWRKKRLSNDNFYAERFTNTILDPQVKESYQFSIHQEKTPTPQKFLPDLEYYPSLLQNAQGVISPLSTMIIESSILNKNVLVIAYNDNVHPISMDTVLRFTHFRNIEQIKNYIVCRNILDLSRDFEKLIQKPEDPFSHKYILPWLFYDNKPYGKRLEQYINKILAEKSNHIPRNNLIKQNINLRGSAN